MAVAAEGGLVALIPGDGAIPFLVDARDPDHLKLEARAEVELTRLGGRKVSQR